MVHVTICDKETEFVQMLADHLNQKYQFVMEVMAFNNVDLLLNFLRTKDCQICFVGEGLLDAYQTEEILQHTKQLDYFTKLRSSTGIFKYQSMDVITREILDVCEKSDPDNFAFEQYINSKKTKIIGFYSPVHHILQSSLALTMGQLIAKDKKSLYVNFEPYSGFEYIMQKKFEHDLMDLMFFLKEDSTKFKFRMESMIGNVGQLDYVPPVFSYPDMEEIDAKSWNRLITRIINETDYEVLLLDLTEQIKGLFSILEMCDEIYSCIPNDGLAMAKMQQYENLLIYLKKEGITLHTKKCKLPVFKEIPYQASLYTHSQLAEYVKGLLNDVERG